MALTGGEDETGARGETNYVIEHRVEEILIPFTSLRCTQSDQVVPVGGLLDDRLSRVAGSDPACRLRARRQHLGQGAEV